MLANKAGFIKQRAWQYIQVLTCLKNSSITPLQALPLLSISVFRDIVVMPPAL
jgi:hypothetical protein